MVDPSVSHHNSTRGGDVEEPPGRIAGRHRGASARLASVGSAGARRATRPAGVGRPLGCAVNGMGGTTVPLPSPAARRCPVPPRSAACGRPPARPPACTRPDPGGRHPAETGPSCTAGTGSRSQRRASSGPDSTTWTVAVSGAFRRHFRPATGRRAARRERSRSGRRPSCSPGRPPREPPARARSPRRGRHRTSSRLNRAKKGRSRS